MKKVLFTTAIALGFAISATAQEAKTTTVATDVKTKTAADNAELAKKKEAEKRASSERTIREIKDKPVPAPATDAAVGIVPVQTQKVKEEALVREPATAVKKKAKTKAAAKSKKPANK